MYPDLVKNFKRQDLFLIIITLLYAVLTLLCVINHEVATDEVQVWQLCKYLNIPELINHLHNEGHPIFFYLLVMPFAKLSSNIMFMQLICWASCCVAVFILLKYSPFKIYTNLAIITSAGFTYFLPVIARSYSVIPILVFLSAILYLKQKSHPILYGCILFLIANTHSIMWGFVAILFVFFIKDLIKEKLYKENKSFIISAVIIFTGLCLVILQLHDTTNSNAFIVFRPKYIFSSAKWVLTNFFANALNYVEAKVSHVFSVDGKLYFDMYREGGFGFTELILVFFSFINFVSILIILLISNKRLFFIAACAISFQLLIYIYAYPYHVYVSRIFCAYLILLFCCWIIVNNNKQVEKKANIMLTIMFLLTSYNGIHYYSKDIIEKCPTEEVVANYIFQNIDKDAILIIEGEPEIVVLSYYLKEKYPLISVFTNEQVKYIKWDKYAGKHLFYDDWINAIKHLQTKFNTSNLYVIESVNGLMKLDMKYFELIYPESKSNDDKYRIYKYIDK